MEKISVTLDLSKIDKDKMTERKYTNRDGKEVVIQEYKFDLVPLKTPKFIKDGGKWTMEKTHFAAEAQTKEERMAGEKSTFIGDGFIFRTKEEVTEQVEQTDEQKAVFDNGDINNEEMADEIPF